jgi:hypothetical protein
MQVLVIKVALMQVPSVYLFAIVHSLLPAYFTPYYCNSWYYIHHLHGLGPMACSGSIVHRILGLPGFFFPLVDIPMLFLGDDVFPFSVDVPIFLYIVLFV